MVRTWQSAYLKFGTVTQVGEGLFLGPAMLPNPSRVAPSALNISETPYLQFNAEKLDSFGLDRVRTSTKYLQSGGPHEPTFCDLTPCASPYRLNSPLLTRHLFVELIFLLHLAWFRPCTKYMSLCRSPCTLRDQIYNNMQQKGTS